MLLTLVEKIAGRFAVDGGATTVRSGDYVTIRPKHIMTHDNTGAVIPKFMSMGASRIADPSQPVFASQTLNAPEKRDTAMLTEFLVSSAI